MNNCTYVFPEDHSKAGQKCSNEFARHDSGGWEHSGDLYEECIAHPEGCLHHEYAPPAEKECEVCEIVSRFEPVKIDPEHVSDLDYLREAFSELAEEVHLMCQTQS